MMESILVIKLSRNDSMLFGVDMSSYGRQCVEGKSRASVEPRNTTGARRVKRCTEKEGGYIEPILSYLGTQN